MAFDGILTKAIVSELNNCLINGKINKIFEPNRNEILFSIYSDKKNYALNISIDSINYRINLTTHSKPNPQNVLNFCMVLRKHLIGGTIKKIYTNGLERIIFIDINCFNELNDLITKTLVIELMGKHSNVILLNSDLTIIDSLRHLNKFDNSNRNIFPGSKYENIVSNKLDFLSIKTFDEFYKSLNISDSTNSLSSLLSKKYNGFGKNNILNLLTSLNIEDNVISTSNLKLLYSSLKNILNNIEASSLKNIAISESSSEKKDYFINLVNYEYDNLSINFFIDDFYTNKENLEHFKSYRDSVLKLILKQIDKLKEKIKFIDFKIENCTKMDNYRLYGELITSNLYRISDFVQSEITLENYYDNNNPITIKLDNRYSPSKNAKLFFKKYRKLQNTNTIVYKQKELALEELTYLDSIVYEISEASKIEEIENIYQEICDNLIYNKTSNTVNNHILNLNSSNKQKNKKNKEDSSLLPTKYLIGDFTVLVGKNNKQNDYLTCKLAKNSDIWFHTKDIHGSHVILKVGNSTNIPDSVLYKCASLAAYYSKARMSQNVPVDYTYVKYVKKPNGAKPGMVIYTNNKTLYVNPKEY